MKSFQELAREEARLVILQALKRQVNGRLPVRMLRDALEVEGHNFSHDWIRTELRKLDELEALKLHDVGDQTAAIAELCERGDDHLARRIVLEGVKRPEFGSSR